MPFEIHTPPWTNFHDLNLDWMIQTIKSLETRVSALENGETPEPEPEPAEYNYYGALATLYGMPGTKTVITNSTWCIIDTSVTDINAFATDVYEEGDSSGELKIKKTGLYQFVIDSYILNSNPSSTVTFAIAKYTDIPGDPVDILRRSVVSVRKDTRNSKTIITLPIEEGEEIFVAASSSTQGDNVDLGSFTCEIVRLNTADTTVTPEPI